MHSLRSQGRKDGGWNILARGAGGPGTGVCPARPGEAAPRLAASRAGGRPAELGTSGDNGARAVGPRCSAGFLFARGRTRAADRGPRHGADECGPGCSWILGLGTVGWPGSAWTRWRSLFHPGPGYGRSPWSSRCGLARDRASAPVPSSPGAGGAPHPAGQGAAPRGPTVPVGSSYSGPPPRPGAQKGTSRGLVGAGFFLAAGALSAVTALAGLRVTGKASASSGWPGPDRSVSGCLSALTKATVDVVAMRGVGALATWEP